MLPDFWLEFVNHLPGRNNPLSGRLRIGLKFWLNILESGILTKNITTEKLIVKQ